MKYRFLQIWIHHYINIWMFLFHFHIYISNRRCGYHIHLRRYKSGHLYLVQILRCNCIWSFLFHSYKHVDTLHFVQDIHFYLKQTAKNEVKRARLYLFQFHKDITNSQKMRTRVLSPWNCQLQHIYFAVGLNQVLVSRNFTFFSMRNMNCKIINHT